MAMRGCGGELRRERARKGAQALCCARVWARLAHARCGLGET